jgi:hypothetical protein
VKRKKLVVTYIKKNFYSTNFRAWRTGIEMNSGGGTFFLRGFEQVRSECHSSMLFIFILSRKKKFLRLRIHV